MIALKMAAMTMRIGDSSPGLDGRRYACFAAASKTRQLRAGCVRQLGQHDGDGIEFGSRPSGVDRTAVIVEHDGEGKPLVGSGHCISGQRIGKGHAAGLGVDAALRGTVAHASGQRTVYAGFRQTQAKCFCPRIVADVEQQAGQGRRRRQIASRKARAVLDQHAVQ
jgi:hypothetical protein